MALKPKLKNSSNLHKEEALKEVVKEKTKMSQAEADRIKENHARMHSLSGSKLRDLAWSLDVLDLKK